MEEHGEFVEKIGIDRAVFGLSEVWLSEQFKQIYIQKSTVTRKYEIKGKDYYLTLGCKVTGRQTNVVIQWAQLDLWINRGITKNMQNRTVAEVTSRLEEISQEIEQQYGVSIKLDAFICKELEINATFVTTLSFEEYIPVLTVIMDWLKRKDMEYLVDCEKTDEIQWPITDVLRSITVKNKSQGYSYYDKTYHLKMKNGTYLSINLMRLEWKLFTPGKIKSVFGFNEWSKFTDEIITEKYMADFNKHVLNKANNRAEIEIKRCKRMFDSSLEVNRKGKKCFSCEKFLTNWQTFCIANRKPPFIDIKDVKEVFNKYDKQNRNGGRTYQRLDQKARKNNVYYQLHSSEAFQDIVEGVERCAHYVPGNPTVSYKAIKLDKKR